MSNNGKFIYLDTANNIGRKINEEIYDKRILKLLNMDPHEIRFRFKASVKKGNLIKISSEWAKKDAV